MAVVLFDGVCNLCQASVQWIIERDPEGKIQFASLQSAYGRAALAKYGLADQKIDSVVFIHENRAFTHSTGALKIASLLGGKWAWMRFFLWVPSFIRNGVYRFIAANRYRWFGKQEACWLPTPDLKKRFLDSASV